MTFREAIAAIPFQSEQPNATGLLAPITRATGHIMYVIATLADTAYELSDEEAVTELGHATTHLTRTIATAEQAPISTRSRSLIAAWVNAVAAAMVEYNDWPADERGRNLKDLADRSAALAAHFDFEFAGLSGSDPGRSL
jgi:hypothetical protein